MAINVNIKKIMDIAKEAGNGILEIYGEEFTVDVKEDKSPLTEADKKSNDIIVAGLTEHYPEFPILSEETKVAEYEERSKWEFFWLIDPLDGTKEFIKRNDEFTVNIALIHQGRPILGVIYVPVFDITYFAAEGQGSYINELGQTRQIKKAEIGEDKKITIAASRSHLNEDTEAFVEEKRKDYEVEFISAGSSLKFCLVAEGKAHFYPRFAPTMEWDTGAGQIIAIEAGATVTVPDTGEPLKYNKEDLLNPYFLVQ